MTFCIARRCGRTVLPVAPLCYTSPAAHVTQHGEPCYPSVAAPLYAQHNAEQRRAENLEQLLAEVESW